MFSSFQCAVMRARQQGGLPLAALVGEQTILDAFGPARSFRQGWIYTHAVTVWTFLSQCLSADHSCREAVARHAIWRGTMDRARRPPIRVRIHTAPPRPAEKDPGKVECPAL